MRRRALLETIAAGATVLTAGCVSEAAPSGPRNPPGADDARSTDPSDEGGRDPGLHVEEFDFLEGEDGELVVEVTVANDASNQRSGTVVAVATTPDRSVQGTEEITLEAGEATTLRLPLDIEFDTFAANGSLSVNIER